MPPGLLPAARSGFPQGKVSVRGTPGCVKTTTLHKQTNTAAEEKVRLRGEAGFASRKPHAPADLLFPGWLGILGSLHFTPGREGRLRRGSPAPLLHSPLSPDRRRRPSPLPAGRPFVPAPQAPPPQPSLRCSRASPLTPYPPPEVLPPRRPSSPPTRALCPRPLGPAQLVKEGQTRPHQDRP